MFEKEEYSIQFIYYDSDVSSKTKQNLKNCFNNNSLRLYTVYRAEALAQQNPVLGIGPKRNDNKNPVLVIGPKWPVKEIPYSLLGRMGV